MTLLKPILYFSLFKYPLTEEEIFNFSKAESKEQIKLDLIELVNDDIIYKIDDFYLTENNETLIKRRLEGNKMARRGFAGKALATAAIGTSIPRV